MQVRSRQLLIFSLVGVFFFQTYLVYSDPVGRRTPPLSEAGARGWKLWHQNNCQSCHQLYGFGGFLGPDLTNAAERLTPSRMESILTVGSERMPAFGLDADQRQAVTVFLEEIDRTGVSQPKLGQALPARELLTELVEAAISRDRPLTEAEQAGQATFFEQNCIDCHLPNRRSAFRSPDLTRVTLDSGHERVRLILIEGVPEKGMPRLGLSEEARENLFAFLLLLERHGETVRRGFENAEKLSTGTIPFPAWFEYPQR